VDINLANAFPGNPNSPHYEERQAVKVLHESEGYDAVCGMHTFGKFGENMGVIDAERGISPIVLGFLGGLGLRKLALTTYGGIQRYASNAFAMEIDPNGLGSDLEKLRAAFDALANDSNHPMASVTDFEWFMHIAGSVSVEHFDPSRLTELERKKLHDFEPLPEAIAAPLGYADKPAYMMSWRYVPNEQGYWGEAITPIAIPDDSLWPK
jgi:hypothetical protein